MNNVFSSLIASLDTIFSFDYFPPDIVAFSKSPGDNSFVVELNVFYRDLSNIPRDVFEKFFKKICLKDILETIISNRSKYTSLTTIYGTIELNIQNLVQKRDLLQSQIDDYINWLPMEDILDWVPSLITAQLKFYEFSKHLMTILSFLLKIKVQRLF